MIPAQLTPESIEALSPDDSLTIQSIANDLHEATPHVLDWASPKDVENEITVRRTLKLKLDEAANQLSARISDLEALKKELRIRKGYAASDIERLESYKIGLYVARKEGRA